MGLVYYYINNTWYILLILTLNLSYLYLFNIGLQKKSGKLVFLGLDNAGKVKLINNKRLNFSCYSLDNFVAYAKR